MQNGIREVCFASATRPYTPLAAPWVIDVKFSQSSRLGRYTVPSSAHRAIKKKLTRKAHTPAITKPSPIVISRRSLTTIPAAAPAVPIDSEALDTVCKVLL